MRTNHIAAVFGVLIQQHPILGDQRDLAWATPQELRAAALRVIFRRLAACVCFRSWNTRLKRKASPSISPPERGKPVLLLGRDCLMQLGNTVGSQMR